MASVQWKLGLAFAWTALVVYWVVAAPPSDPTLERALWGGLAMGRFGDIDPSIIAVFLLLGINADLYIILLLRDGRFQRVPGWPFGVAMFGLGSFVLVPYLLLRRKDPRLDVPVGRVTRLVSSRPVGWLLVVALAGLCAWGIANGSAAAFSKAFHTSMLVHVMTLDFLLEVLLLWPVVEESRRLDPPAVEPSLARAVRWIPLFGPALWGALVVRQSGTHRLRADPVESLHS
jgi:hypothetical protein